MKKILKEKDKKIHSEIWKWAKDEILTSLENDSRDFIQMAYQVKLINQTGIQINLIFNIDIAIFEKSILILLKQYIARN